MVTSPPFLQTFEERESLLLAPFAMRARDSRGRRHPEPAHPYRSPYQRDRDRVLHCSAFRRLSGKMQVFTGEMGDYHRTRLTHTHEVASIARTIGRALRLNEDLIEALALFHDIGHPPFGHAGEDVLNRFLAEEGGFSHNRHALTLAEELETRYVTFPGLNLTQEVLDGQAARVDKNARPQQPLLEAQVVDLADSITYDAHDTDDAVKLELVRLEELKPLALVDESLERIQRRNGNLPPSTLRKALVHELIDRQVSDLLEANAPRLYEAEFSSAQEARLSGFRLAPSREMVLQRRELETFLYRRVYRHPRLIEVRSQAQHRLQALLDHFLAAPEGLPQKFRLRSVQVGLPRAVAEYVAGMTDRYCQQQYQQRCENP